MGDGRWDLLFQKRCAMRRGVVLGVVPCSVSSVGDQAVLDAGKVGCAASGRVSGSRAREKRLSWRERRRPSINRNGCVKNGGGQDAGLMWWSCAPCPAYVVFGCWSRRTCCTVACFRAHTSAPNPRSRARKCAIAHGLCNSSLLLMILWKTFWGQTSME
jgi:hypothetical protein